MSRTRQEAVVHFLDAFHHVTRKGIIFLRIFWHPVRTIRTYPRLLRFLHLILEPYLHQEQVASCALRNSSGVGRLLSVIAFVLNVASQCF